MRPGRQLNPVSGGVLGQISDLVQRQQCVDALRLAASGKGHVLVFSEFRNCLAIIAVCAVAEAGGRMAMKRREADDGGNADQGVGR